MGKFKILKTSIDGVVIIEPELFCDSRGSFMETYTKRDFYNAGIKTEFVQENHSVSSFGVLRGLHFQKEHSQAKLIRCISGEVYDVCVDLRKKSPTFGKWEGVTLSAENRRQFFIPKDFAHGFLVLSEKAEIVYKVDDYYCPEGESGIMWNDKELAIDWHIKKDMNIILSNKDKCYPPFCEFKR